MVVPFLAAAQSVTLYGTLSNFDVVNDTGGPVHGFEIEFHGVSGANSYYNWNRYGPPQVTPMPGGGGVYVRWMSPYDPASGKFVTGTPMAVHPTAMTGHQCIIGTQGYEASGCEHFGLATAGNATKIVYHWLVPDSTAPGQLKTYGSQVAIPAPVWSVQPPARPGQPVDVLADVDPPIPPPPAKLYGPAQWMKTYKSESDRQVNLDELVADAPVVPQHAAQIETEWDLLQTELGSNSKRRQKRGGLGNGKRAVVRRLELYKYTGPVDPVTGKALCADGLCNVPAPGEVGDFIGAQNAAANLNVPAEYPVTVTVAGDGQVSSDDRLIRCPGACSSLVLPHTTVTLTAKEGKGVFAGWTGACAGMSLTCTVTVDSAATATATFLPRFRLDVRLSGVGAVSSNPTGSTFVQGTAVTLTAAAAAGNQFAGWSGACSGTVPVCTVWMTADYTATATFTPLSGPAPAPAPAPAIPTYRLVVRTNGKGTVTTNPSGRDFAAGALVTLSAVPDAGSTWIGWSGACSGTSRTCVVTMSNDQTATANFR